MEKTLTEPLGDHQRRKLATDAMSLALQYWQHSTGLSKIDFAERSAIWKIYVNHNGFERTQTLDKYLDLSLLPKKPRWQKVIETIEFVLLACDKQSSDRDKLEEKLLQLKYIN